MVKRGTALDRWADLFDAEYVANACRAIAEAMRGEREPAAMAAMAATIRRHLMAPLSAYLDEHSRPGPQRTNVQAAERLHDKADRLADLLADRYPFAPDEVTDRAETLRVAWLEFIAHAAGPMVYHDLVKAHWQRTTAGRRPRGTAAALTPELLAERVKAEGGHFPDWLAAALADEFSVSERTVYRRLAAARARALIP